MNKRILVINPNTSPSVTGMVLAHCRRAAPGLDWHGATSRIGAAYIASEVAYAVAAHAVLDTYAESYDGHDAVLIACFGDPGLLALQDLATVPVIGLAQASFLATAARGRFAVVTGGAAWGPMLTRFARMHQLDAELVGIYTVALTGAEIAAAPAHASEALLASARQGVADGATQILLGGAALAGMAEGLQTHLPVPIGDNVVLAAHAVLQAATQAGSHADATRLPAPGSPMLGVGVALSRLLEARVVSLRA